MDGGQKATERGAHLQRFAQDDRDLRLFERLVKRAEDVPDRAACTELHHNPQTVLVQIRADVVDDVLVVARCVVCQCVACSCGDACIHCSRAISTLISSIILMSLKQISLMATSLLSALQTPAVQQMSLRVGCAVCGVRCTVRARQTFVDSSVRALPDTLAELEDLGRVLLRNELDNPLDLRLLL